MAEGWIFESIPEGISTMWNVNKLAQYLNSNHQVHFLFHKCTPDPFTRTGYDTRSNCNLILTEKHSELFFSLTGRRTESKEPCVPYVILIAWWRIIGLVLFPRVVVLCEMHSGLSSIWTHVSVTIYYYTMCTSHSPPSLSLSPHIYIYVCVCVSVCVCVCVIVFIRN